MLKKLLIIPALTAALAGCGPSEVEIDKVEAEIRTGVLEQSGVEVTVDCPSKVDWEVGHTFNCVVEAVSDGSRAMAEVTMENDEGEVTWRLN